MDANANGGKVLCNCLIIKAGKLSHVLTEALKHP